MGKQTLEVYGTSAAAPQRIYINGVEITDWLKGPIELVEERENPDLDLRDMGRRWQRPEVHAVFEVQLDEMIHRAAEANPHQELRPVTLCIVHLSSMGEYYEGRPNLDECKVEGEFGYGPTCIPAVVMVPVWEDEEEE